MRSSAVTLRPEGSAAVARMNTLDAEFYFVEHENIPTHIGSLAVFYGPAPSHADLLALYAAKLSLVPRYRQVVRTLPGQVIRPFWSDDEYFDLGYHLRHAGGELTDGLIVRTLVPVSLRAADERRPVSNRVSAVLTNLPVGEPDPVRRVEVLHGQMADLKRSGQAVGAEFLTEILGLAELLASVRPRRGHGRHRRHGRRCRRAASPSKPDWDSRPTRRAKRDGQWPDQPCGQGAVRRAGRYKR